MRYAQHIISIMCKLCAIMCNYVQIMCIMWMQMYMGDVLLNAKTQRKCATSRALRTPVDRRIEPQGSKAAPLLRYHMGSAMATEQYLARRRGDLYTVRASTQAPP